MKRYLLFLFSFLFLFSCDKIVEEDQKDQKEPQDVAVTSISISQPSAEMIVGETLQLRASLEPSNATDKTVIWASSKQSVASISTDGLVTALAVGTTTITASAGSKTSSCTVTVEAASIAVASVALDRNSVTLEEGQSTTLTATVSPADATDKEVSWSTSDADVATVDQEGKVTAIKEGTASITAAAGGKSATCVVTVAKKVIPVTSVTLDQTQLNMARGESATLIATVLPENATDKTVTWSSSDATIAYVTQEGTVVAMKPGTAVVMAKAGEKSATCVVVITVPVTSITLDSNSITIEEGQTTTLTAVVSPSDATDKTVAWSTSDSAVAVVDQSGQVTAVKAGNAIITAKAGELSATCAVTVAKKVVPVTSVTLNKTSLDMIKGETATLQATVKPDDASDKTVTWSSSDETIASVDQQGKVKALKGGKATITAKAGEVSATCQVSITVPVESISLDKSSLDMKAGESYTLTATVNPSDVTDASVTWSSSNDSVASVDQNGKVTAQDNGTATITAKAGGKQATCSISVTVPVESIALDRNAVTLEVGKSTILSATISPANATNKTVKWSSSNEYIASVDQNGKVNAVQEGTANITAEAGGKTAVCMVAVAKVIIPVTSVTLDKTSLSLTKGESATLSATVKPDEATDKTVTWSSSDATVAGVDQSGKVAALKGGNVTIMAKAGEAFAFCTVSITVPVSSVSLDKTSLSLEEGNSAQLTATVNPSDATDKSLSWSSANTSIATVDQNGKVTAVKEGSVYITVSASGKSATCAVTVSKKIIRVTSVTLDKSSVDMYKGESITLVATVSPDNATYKNVTWSSSDVSVASVDQSGKVTAVKGGSAVITASADGCSAGCAVNITVPVQSVTLNHTSLQIVEGEKVSLTATVNPSDATNKAVSWSTSDASIVTVDAQGGLRGVSLGSATITASAGGKSATCTVAVVKDEFVITPTSVDIPVEGGTFTVAVTSVRGYHINSKPDWITETSVNEKVHSFSVGANDADNSRSGVIVFCDDKGTCLSVTVTQKGTGGFSVSPAKVEMDLSGGTAAITISTGLSWTASSNASWCKVSTASGSGSATLTLTVERYEEKGTRSATVTIKAQGNRQATVTVDQEGKVDFAVNPNSVTVEGEGGTFEVKVSSSVGYHINSKPDWISEISKDGKRHTFKVEANPNLSDRSGVIVFCDDEGTCLPCSVKQKGRNSDGTGDNEDVNDGDPINW